MNPIIVIGLVSVVTAGMYGMYDGLDKQAELAALHADMLARQHAAHTTYVSGVMEEKQHVIISNNGPQPAELIQVRAYDDTSTLTDTWEMSYVLPPLQEFNMSSAVMPAPPSDLTGSALENSLDNDNYYRGVTSAGAIFDIVLAPSSGTNTPDNTYGPMATMPLNGGGGSASHVGGITAVNYHYAEPTIECHANPTLFGAPAYRIHQLTFIHSAYSTSTTGPGTPQPTSPVWYDLSAGTFTHGEHDPDRLCSSYTIGLSPILSGMAPLPGYNNVYHETLWTSGTTVNLSLPLDSDFTAPSDGRMLLRVEVPVSASTSASYDGSSQLMFVNQLCLDAHDYPVSQFETTVENTVSRWESALGAPTLTPVFNARINGSPSGSFDMSDVVPVGGSVAANRNHVFDKWADGGGWDCTMTLTADIDGSWSLAGILVGLLEVPVANGDVVDVDGTVRLRYTPPSVAGAAVDTTNARLELGDAVITMGILPP